MLGVPGATLSDEMREWYRDIQPAGFILFGRNVESPTQLRSLIDNLRSTSRNDEPIIAIDEEGGRVSRLRSILDHPLPSPGEIAKHGNKPGHFSQLGILTADLLRLFGFNFDCAPVLDRSLGSDAADGVLRQRCFGDNTQDIISHAGLFLRSLRKGNIHGCGKHFPTYTGAAEDPHNGLPTIPGDVPILMAGYAAPFVAMLPDMPAVMTAHAWFPGIDPETPGLPASLSENVIHKWLRNQLGFEGLVLTDDLDMAGAQAGRSVAEAAKSAIEVGSDIVLVCHQLENVPDVVKAIGELPHNVLSQGLERVEKFRRKLKSPRAFSDQQLAKLNQRILDFRISVFGSKDAALKHDYDAQATNVEAY